MKKVALLLISAGFLLFACNPNTTPTPGTNKKPIASFTASATQGQIGITINFDASVSSDPDGTISSYSWNFGDGQTGTKVTVKHTFNVAGTFEVSLTVVDNKNASNKVSKTITIDNKPATGLAACGSDVMNDNNWKDPQNDDSLPYVKDELLLKFKAATGLSSQAIAEQYLQEFNLKSLKEYSDYRPTLVKIPAGQDPLEYAALLRQDPRIEYAEPNYYFEIMSTPNDPHYSHQWNLKEFGLEQAWGIETGKNEVVIAIIDTGVYTKHEDLASKILPGCDFYYKDNNPNPVENGTNQTAHGTHVAGIAAAIGNNSKGVAGVAYGSGVKIVPINVFKYSGKNAPLDVTIDGLLWAAGIDLPGVGKNPNPANIINMSLGGEYTPENIKSLSDATKLVKDKGVLMVASSGNSGLKWLIFYPAADKNVVAVGSVDVDRKRSNFSNYNKNGRTVDLVAPGGFGNKGSCNGISNQILSTFPNNEYACLAGTSMAAPFVSGVAALLWSQNPSLTAAQIKAKLKSTALFTANMNHGEYGAGIVCADKALGANTQCGK